MELTSKQIELVQQYNVLTEYGKTLDSHSKIMDNENELWKIRESFTNPKNQPLKIIRIC